MSTGCVLGSAPTRRHRAIPWPGARSRWRVEMTSDPKHAHNIRTFVTDDGTVTVEGFAQTVRYHPSGIYGSPFSFVCTLTVHGTEAIAFAGLGAITPKVRRAIAAALREFGITRVRYERRARGGKRKVLATK